MARDTQDLPVHKNKYIVKKNPSRLSLSGTGLLHKDNCL